MKLHELTDLLKNNAEKSFRLALPNGSPVPVSFHITEVGYVQKTFLDCGGKLHKSETCQLQVWHGEDEDHRIASGKMADILDKARSFLPNGELPVEIEYEDGVISQYAVDGYSLDDDAVVLKLANKHTACLAMELCGLPAKKSGDAQEDEGCCSSSGCC